MNVGVTVGVFVCVGVGVKVDSGVGWGVCEGHGSFPVSVINT